MSFKRKNSARIDTVIEKLFNEFIKADKVREDPIFLNLMFKTIKHFSEIQDFKGMYRHYFIPTTNKYMLDFKKAIRKSRYKKLITNEFVDLEENKHETVRLAIVGLYHKYESFRKDLVRNFNDYLTNKGIDIDIKEYIENNFDFKLKENWKNSALYEVNWICNRVKHDSSLPISFENPNRSIPVKFADLDNNKKIIILPSEFYIYCDSIYKYCHDLFQLFNQVNLKIQLCNDGLDTQIETLLLDGSIEQMIRLLNDRSIVNNN